MPTCHNCKSRQIPPKNRKYCTVCSPRASAIWKAAHRAAWQAQWRAQGFSGQPPYLDGWVSAQAYREYHRRYMRRWRKSRQESMSCRSQDVA